MYLFKTKFKNNMSWPKHFKPEQTTNTKRNTAWDSDQILMQNEQTTI